MRFKPSMRLNRYNYKADNTKTKTDTDRNKKMDKQIRNTSGRKIRGGYEK